MGGSGDPTLEFLSRLADESKWVIRRNIPIFEPHVRYAKGLDGEDRKIEVTADDLPEIAAVSAAREKRKGVPGRVTDRHTVRPRADGKGMEPVPPTEIRLFGF